MAVAKSVNYHYICPMRTERLDSQGVQRTGVNVSLDPDLRQRLRLLATATHRPVSRIVTAALRLYFAQLSPSERDALEATGKLLETVRAE